MAPGIVSDLPIHSEPALNGTTNGVRKETKFPQPLRPSGKLDEFKWEDATPVIGREYPSINIVDDLMNASNADELLRDLAITSKLKTKVITGFNINIRSSLAAWRRILQSASKYPFRDSVDSDNSSS
jgi:hypothetical protein